MNSNQTGPDSFAFANTVWRTTLAGAKYFSIQTPIRRKHTVSAFIDMCSHKIIIIDNIG